MTSYIYILVVWNEYFMPRVQPSFRLCGPLSTSRMGAGRHLWPDDCVSTKWTPPCGSLKPISVRTGMQ